MYVCVCVCVRACVFERQWRGSGGWRRIRTLREKKTDRLVVQAYEVGHKVQRLPCLHIFHLDCSEEWMREQKQVFTATFTCFTSTKVQILTPEDQQSGSDAPSCPVCKHVI